MPLKIYPLLFALLFRITVLRAQTLPDYSVTICQPQSTGYYFFSGFKPVQKSSSFLPIYFILDHAGHVIYFELPQAKKKAGDFKLLSNGLIARYDTDKFILLDKRLRVVDSVFPKNGLISDDHDLLQLPNGHYVLLGIEEVKMDLSAYTYFCKKNITGSRNAKVKCGVIQEQDKNGHVVFEWHSKNYFKFDDVDPYFLSDSANVDWTHFNAVALDQDGNFLVSSRYLNEITKVRRCDSTIVWRLGGKHNQFMFTNDAQQFVGQHDIRRLGNGHITLFDNGRAGTVPHPATAKEYALDENKLTATLAWQYINDSAAHSLFSGNLQTLPNGNRLINYGTSDRSATLFNVIQDSGNKIFEFAFTDTACSYRAYNYPALPWQLKRPELSGHKKNGKLYLDAGAGYSDYLWSTGETTRTIEVNKTGTYFAYSSMGPGRFVASLPVTIGIEDEHYHISKKK